MPNGDMPSWEEWSQQLSEEQRQYSIFKTLEAIHKKLNERADECGDRFRKLENTKFYKSGAAFIGGIIGGIITVISGWAFWKGGAP